MTGTFDEAFLRRFSLQRRTSKAITSRPKGTAIPALTAIIFSLLLAHAIGSLDIRGAAGCAVLVGATGQEFKVVMDMGLIAEVEEAVFDTTVELVDEVDRILIAFPGSILRTVPLTLEQVSI